MRVMQSVRRGRGERQHARSSEGGPLTSEEVGDLVDVGTVE